MHQWKVINQEIRCAVCGINKGMAWAKLICLPDCGTTDNLIDKHCPCLTDDELMVKDVIE